ncbi:unnamed protein product [Fraxinus pennsylvanica]|uniref:RNase H type-1 domain-containing protein n=1 Tax=Fraxinus pennsylvanica TaxID=56036 RepID=A0AAD2ACH8_9LAMI|nr:unnamed protein product [Fraxinus pennsylvanica]
MEGKLEFIEATWRKIKAWISWVGLKLKEVRTLSRRDVWVLKELNIPVKPIKEKGIKVVRWQRPMQGWYKLNTDGCCLGNPGICGAGCIIRNEKGDIVIAFTKYLGEGTNNGAELLVLLYGLRRAKRMGLNRLEVELDSLIIVNWLKRKVCGIRYLEDYWEEIQYLLSIISCRVQHIHCEGNLVANILSKLGASSVSHIWMDSIAIPSSVRGALRMDKLDI